MSGTSLADIQHNVAAIDRAWHGIFAPSIATKDKKLANFKLGWYPIDFTGGN